MNLEWDYTEIAELYATRPNYASKAVNSILEIANIKQNSEICDVGAGAGRLTIVLAQNGLHVTAIEPNESMRAIGEARTSEYPNVSWIEGTAEDTFQDPQSFDLAVFGSSFHTTDRMAALKEVSRILLPGAWFACLWNHRDLNDPLQASIENFITNAIPGYRYGIRREDQSQILHDSNLFGNIQRVSQTFRHFQTLDDCLAGWKSHLTLARQAGDNFGKIIQGIEKILSNTGLTEIEVPYTTRAWMARLR